MAHLPILALATLPNGESTEIYLADMESDNWVSPQIVNSLSKTGQIIYDGDQVFVEFERENKYFDGAWCKIGSMADAFIILGKDWLEERSAVIDPERKSCTVRPSHLPGTFTVYNTLTPPQKEEKSVLVELYEPDPAWIEAYDDDPLCGDDLFEVLPTAPELLIVPELRVTSELLGDPELVVTPELLGDPKLVVAPELLGDPQLVVTPELLGDPELVVAPGLLGDPEMLVTVKSSDMPPLHVSSTQVSYYDAVWHDFSATHEKRRSDILFIMMCAEPPFDPLGIVLMIIKHFKIRGRIFSNQGSLTGTSDAALYKNSQISENLFLRSDLSRTSHRSSDNYTMMISWRATSLV